MTEVLPDGATTSDRKAGANRPARWSGIRSHLPRYSIAAVLVVIVLICLGTEHGTFATSDNLSSLVRGQTVPLVVAIAILVPLVVGEFDISLAQLMGVASLFFAQCAVQWHIPLVPAMLLTWALALGVSGVVAFCVVYLGLNSFIVTLGVSTILVGVSQVTSDVTITGLPKSFVSAGLDTFLGLPIMAWLALLVAIVVGYLLSQTPFGRSSYAVGAGAEAARLSGVPAAAVRTTAFLIGGTLAAIAGIMEASLVGAASPTVGPAFLLPAFAAVFLGATMGRGGRYNILGTIIAVALIAVGINGLELAGVPVWVEPFFNGGALVLAVLVARVASKIIGRARVKT